MAFKEIKEVKINTQSFSDFFNVQTTDIDKGYNNYLLGQRQDCTMNSLFKYDINNIKGGSGNSECGGVCPRLCDKLFGQLSKRNHEFNYKLASQSEPILINSLDYVENVREADRTIINVFSDMYDYNDETKTPISSETDYDSKKLKIINILHKCATKGLYIFDSFYNNKIYVNNMYDVDKRSEELSTSHNWNNNTTYWPVYNFWCIMNMTGGVNSAQTMPGPFSNTILGPTTYTCKVSLCCGIPTYYAIEQLAIIYLYDTSLPPNSRNKLGNYIANIRKNLTVAANKIKTYRPEGNERLIGTNVGSITDDNPDWKVNFDGKFYTFNSIAWSMGIDYDKVVDIQSGNIINWDEMVLNGTSQYNLVVRDIDDWFLVSRVKVDILSKSDKHTNNSDIGGYIDNGIQKLFGNITYSIPSFNLNPSINTNTSSTSIIEIFKTIYNYTNISLEQKAYYDTEDKISLLLYECVKKGKCIYDTTTGYKINITKPIYKSSPVSDSWYCFSVDIKPNNNGYIFNGQLFVTIQIGVRQGDGTGQRYTNWRVLKNPKYIEIDSTPTHQNPDRQMYPELAIRNDRTDVKQYVFSWPANAKIPGVSNNYGSERLTVVSQETYGDQRAGRVNNYNLNDTNKVLHGGGCCFVLRAWGDNSWDGKYEKLLRLPNAVSTKANKQNLDGCMSHEDKYFLDSLKEKFGWSDSSKTFASGSVLEGDYEVLASEINDIKNTLSMG